MGPLLNNNNNNNSKCITLSKGDLCDWGVYELGISVILRPMNYCISETVQDRTKVAINH